jgi:energy-converting hydrogenase Eha subunit E
VKQGRWLQRVAATQGIFYVLTGIWPLVDIASFEAVTGPKVELWLVRTVGVLVIVIGGVLVFAARRNSIGLEITALAVGSALGLAGIDAIYALSRTIPPIYLADAVLELGFVAGWLLGWRRT